MSGGRFSPTKAPRRACLKLADWPEADRGRWHAALQPVDPLDPLIVEGGERSNHADVSNRKAEKGYGRYLTFLIGQGCLDVGERPADRITQERVAAYVQELVSQDSASQTILARLQELGEVAVVFDRDRDWTFIKRMASQVRARHRPVRDKRSRVVQTDELLALGIQLMAEASSETTDHHSAILYRDGLLIALLALRPMRRKNITSLQLGRHLRRIQAGWWISFDAAEMKTRVPFEAPFPDYLVPFLHTYLELYRPLLAARCGRWAAEVGGALWVTQDGSPMTQQSVYDRVCHHTLEWLGKLINPHLFRDCAATTIAIHDPEQVRAASALLGHGSPATTERHYQHAKSLEAHRLYTKSVNELRQEQPKPLGQGAPGGSSKSNARGLRHGTSGVDN